MNETPIPKRLGEHAPAGFDPATQALLSALIRELPELERWSVSSEAGSHTLELPLPSQSASVRVPLRGPIGVGRIAAGPARLRDANGVEQAIDVSELIARLVDEPRIAATIGLDRASAATRERFVARVRASAANLAQTLALRADDLDHLAHSPLGFIEAEQGLVLGHSVHPAPRLREGLRDDTDARYIPELGGATPLHLWAVARERLLVGGGEAASARLDQLIASDPEWATLADSLDEAFTLLPLHPCQARALASELVDARGQLRPLGPIGRHWSPTSSLRTLFTDGSPWMLKVSLPIRLTNSLRTLSPAELERGVLLGRVLHETEASALERRHPNFRILREPAYFGLRDLAGGPAPRESFIALRDNPFRADQPAEVLATLLQDHGVTGRSRLALRIEQAAARSGLPAVALADRWFTRFCAVVLDPILEAQADFGLLLSAHQQNLVLGFADTGPLAGIEPQVAWFRDAQGTAYTELAARRLSERLPAVARSTFRSPLAERVWAYSVVINGVFNAIASLAMIPGVGVAALLERLRAVLEAQRERGPVDPRGLDYLLDAPQLWTKANVFCFASDLDEVSLADPQAVYRAIANPLARPDVVEHERPAGRRRAARFANAEGPDQTATIELGAPPSSPGWRPGQIELGAEQRRFELREAGPRAELRWLDHGSERTHSTTLDHLFSTHAGLRHVLVNGDVVVRDHFFQQRSPWHCAGELTAELLGDTARTTTGAIEHPRRPSAPAGQLYARYCPSIDRNFTLHSFDPDRDFDRFCGWMQDPVVAQFWEQDWPRAQLRDRIDALIADPHVIPAIGRFDDLPFAYFEIYWAKEDRLGPHYAAHDYDRGFHMAIGEPEVRHRGWGRQWFLSMAHFCFLDDPRTQRLVGEPRIDQSRVRGWADTTAWREWGEVQFPHKRAALMVLTRDRFFAEFGS
ncbi:GNAT family N-acetyltransferase [Enhygromyxa salina]|uniref:N(2)-citryl-N(6)-acetyl-N(6)-hydroxylysine synthase n=1 Tax=Enhygromyxa salina TaxID=215803 RepID=A0A2S9YVB4_9BACT|nr:GNAT family N-acetyltransferase [Enhygromyxa salina]PRQ09047.1 N(2)-citryl-N(6)-acetyl-N(6)-hydroxylysine synthase [Enhygromyxa salina]